MLRASSLVLPMLLSASSVLVLLLAASSSLAFQATPPLQQQQQRRPLTALRATTVPVKSFESGASVGEATLDLKTARSGKDMYIVHKKYVNERRSARQGTASTKTRGEVSGGGRKPYKQKGSGNARRGSTRSPLIVGGGVAHGPKPKNWANKKVNKKEAALAVSIAIQNKAPQTVVVDELCGKLQFPPKTKAVVKLLDTLNLPVGENIILVVDQYDKILDKSQANVPKLQLKLYHDLTVSDLLWANHLVFSKPAFDAVQAKLGASSSSSSS